MGTDIRVVPFKHDTGCMILDSKPIYPGSNRCGPGHFVDIVFVVFSCSHAVMPSLVSTGVVSVVVAQTELISRCKGSGAKSTPRVFHRASYRVEQKVEH